MTWDNYAGDSLLPAGGEDLPGLDVDWQTFAKRTKQTVTYTDTLVEPNVERTLDVEVGTILKIYRMAGAPGYNSVEGPAIEDFSDDIEEYTGQPLAAPVGPGETLYFELTLAVTGAGDFNFGVVVRTPPNPTGGFQVNGQSLSGLLKGNAYGADFFNNPAGVLVAGQADGYTVARVRGVLGNGDSPGMLKFQLGPATETNLFVLSAMTYESFADCALI